MKNQNKKTEKSFFRTSMKIAVPVALQAMLQSSFSIIDQVMVGQLGEDAIAAVEVGGKAGFVFSFVSGAVATVAGIMVSQYIGKNDDEKVRTSMSVNLCVVFVIAAITSFLCFFIPRALSAIFTKDDEVISFSSSYLRIISAVFPLSGIATILAIELRCKGHSSVPLFISAASAVVNTLLNYVLIFGHFGFNAMGVRGAAVASVISQIVNLFLMMIFHRRLCGFKFSLKMSGDELKQYAAMLLPIVANEFLWTCGQNVNTFVYGHMGTAELAGMSLMGPVQGLFCGALSGLSQAAGILVGKRLGEKNYDAAYTESKKLCRYALIGSVGLSILLIIFGKFYVQMYNIENNVRAIGNALLITFAILAPVKVLNMVLGGGVIRSGGRTKYIMMIDMAGTWLIGVPLALITGLVLKLKIVWVYFILSQEELFRLVVTLFMFKSRKWMNTIE